MSDSKLKPYGDIKVKTGEYINKDGETKGRYSTVGTLFATPHFSRISIKLDVLPMGDGWLNVYKREDADQSNGPITQNEVLEKSGDIAPVDIDDKPIDLSQIPF